MRDAFLTALGAARRARHKDVSSQSRPLRHLKQDMVDQQRRARQRPRSFPLRQGHAYAGWGWGPAHERFLSKIQFEDPAQHMVFAEYRLAVRFATERVARIEEALRQQTAIWRWRPVKDALMTLRGELDPAEGKHFSSYNDCPISEVQL